MNFFEAHRPYLLGLIAAIVLYSYQASATGFLISWLFFSVLAAYIIPDGWVRATPTAEQGADAAIIFGFGYVMDGDVMLPGAANEFMVDWLITNRPDLTLILVQEGVNAEFEQRRMMGKLPDGLKLINLYEHKPGVYVNSLDVAGMVAPVMHSEGIRRILVITHHLQLKRAAGDVAQLVKRSYPEGEVIIPDLPDIPFPGDSAQWHSSCKWRYKLVELLLSRPRDYLKIKLSPTFNLEVQQKGKLLRVEF